MVATAAENSRKFGKHFPLGSVHPSGKVEIREGVREERNTRMREEAGRDGNAEGWKRERSTRGRDLVKLLFPKRINGSVLTTAPKDLMEN